MVIGFDASRAFIKNKTGTENYSYQLLKALSKLDRKNRYIIYINPHDTISTIVEDMLFRAKNFKFVSISLPRFWTQFGLAQRTFRDNLDVLFIPAHTSPLIHKSGLKTVVTVHDLGAEYLPKMHQLKQRLYLKWITHYQLKSASSLIAVSKATKDDLIKNVGIDPKKIKVVYESYDESLFKPVKGDLLVNRLISFKLVGMGYFLFVGTVQPRKNLDRLIRAYANLSSDAPLVIVGSKGWLSEAIYKLPKLLKISDKVKFLGYVSDKDMPALYSGAIALVFPSLFEGFGLPILEAQASGCPVLTSNVSSMPEVAGAGAVYVNPYSVEDIMEGMERVKREWERVKLIKAGFENIKKFSWQKCARETLNVLENL